jgi:phage terminase large subunit
MATEMFIPEQFEPLFYNEYTFYVYYGGRSGCKSHSMARALLIKGMQQKLRILCVREFYSSIKDSVKSLLDDLIEEYDLGHFYSSTHGEITGINGTEILFGGLKINNQNVKGKEKIDIMWADEADKISESSWDLAIPTIIRTEGASIWISFNPDEEDAPVMTRFINSNRPDIFKQKVTFHDNPWFKPAERMEMEYCKKHDYDKYLWIWEGNPRNTSESAVFKNWTIGEVGVPKDNLYYQGLDFGYAEDPAAFIKCYIDEDSRTLYITDEAYGYHVEIEELPNFINSVPGAKDNWIIADSARPDTISYLYRKDFYIEASKKGPGSIMEGIEFIQNYSIIVDPKCVNTIHELSHYSFKTDKITGKILPKVPEDKYNHLMDALRYALESYRLAVDYTIAVPG